MKDQYGLGRGSGRSSSVGSVGRGRGRGKGKSKLVVEEGEGEKKLRVLVKELEKVKVPQGQMLDDAIHQLQQYYGNAIRASVDNLEKMTDACWAVFYHCLSTDKNPTQHDKRQFPIVYSHVYLEYTSSWPYLCTCNSPICLLLVNCLFSEFSKFVYFP